MEGKRLRWNENVEWGKRMNWHSLGQIAGSIEIEMFNENVKKIVVLWNAW